jgi:hypothetical protein
VSFVSSLDKYEKLLAPGLFYGVVDFEAQKFSDCLEAGLSDVASPSAMRSVDKAK